MKLIYSLLIPLLFLGCSQEVKRVEVIKYKFIKAKYPCLKVYEVNKGLKMRLYNKGDLVCFKDGAGCIKKDKFLKIVNYILKLKATNDKLLNEINTYNKTFCKGRKWSN